MKTSLLEHSLTNWSIKVKMPRSIHCSIDLSCCNHTVNYPAMLESILHISNDEDHLWVRLPPFPHPAFPGDPITSPGPFPWPTAADGTPNSRPGSLLPGATKGHLHIHACSCHGNLAFRPSFACRWQPRTPLWVCSGWREVKRGASGRELARCQGFAHLNASPLSAAAPAAFDYMRVRWRFPAGVLGRGWGWLLSACQSLCCDASLPDVQSLFMRFTMKIWFSLLNLISAEMKLSKMGHIWCNMFSIIAGFMKVPYCLLWLDLGLVHRFQCFVRSLITDL